MANCPILVRIEDETFMVNYIILPFRQFILQISKYPKQDKNTNISQIYKIEVLHHWK